MITHNEFTKKWIGKKYEESPQLGAQCVALDKLYYSEVEGKTLGKFGGSAIEGWRNTANTFPKEYWTRFDYKPGIKTIRGDIIFYPKTKSNPYGHTAIAHDDAVQIEQNGGRGSGTGTGSDAIRNTPIDYKTILGWYRLNTKITIPNNSQYVSRKEVASVAQALAPKEMVWNGERGGDNCSLWEFNAMFGRALRRGIDTPEAEEGAPVLRSEAFDRLVRITLTK